ncbi:hypothetical protein GTQ43_34190 [Nostoc sp. KVJ3]|uniref:transposase n=1 Tax=Nostoc sp. KVJ3 TaxID=457945 RepID=UPI002237814E|nr:transposase [Nostoc sp. KVJ3]MCW5318574.1 hypothetical protein [Nostoc sp. KVJ3]
MKMFIIGTASFLALPVGIALLNVSLGSTAYGQQSASNKQVCESIPPARPTGGATLQRLEAAYVLMNALRSQCLAKTELKNSQVGTIRTKLLKLGALITISSRRTLIAITSSSPVKHIFAAAYRCLKMLSNTA